MTLDTVISSERLDSRLGYSKGQPHEDHLNPTRTIVSWNVQTITNLEGSYEAFPHKSSFD